MIEYQNHWSRCLWMFSPFPLKGQTDAFWKILNRQQSNCPESRSRLPDWTCQFRNFTTDSQCYWLKCKPHMTARVLSKRFFVVHDAVVQTQHITNHLVKVPLILMVQSSFLVLGYFYLFRQNGSQHWWKCLWKGMKEPSASPWTTGSWQVLTSASSISPFGQPNQFIISTRQNFVFNSSAPFSTLSMW